MKERVSVSAAVALYLEELESRRRPSTVALYRHYLERFATQVAELELAELRRRHVEIWSSKKVPLQILRTFFRWCQLEELLDASPMRGVVVGKSGRRERLLERRERVLLRRLARPELRALLLALEETGARPCEMREIDWNSLKRLPRLAITEDLSRLCGWYFELAAYKARLRRRNPHSKRVIPVSPRLARLLERLRARARGAPRGPIFRAPRGPSFSSNGFRCAFRRLRAKLAAAAQIAGAGLVPYLLRHSKATELALAGAHPRLLADFLGHASVEMVSWYVHPSTRDLCELVTRRRRA